MNAALRPSLVTATAAALLLSGCQQAYFHALNARVPALAQSVQFDARHGLDLDIYRPAMGSGKAPVMVYFYGGSWREGSRAYYRFVGQALSQRGVLVLIPDYRKAPRDVFPAFMEDAAAATAWAHSHAAELGGDPSRIYLMGHSAGAHIAALLATDPSYLGKWQIKPRQLAGVIGLAGPYDFLPVTEPKIIAVFGAHVDWARTQPVNFVNGDEPPFLLLHGGSDRLVGERNSENLAARLRAAGEPVTLRIIPGTGHVALVNGFRSTLFSPVLKETLDWMQLRGGNSAAAGASQPY